MEEKRIKAYDPVTDYWILGTDPADELDPLDLAKSHAALLVEGR